MPLANKVWAALGGDPSVNLKVEGEGALPSVHAVTDLAIATIGAAGRATAELARALFGHAADVTVDRRLASLWFARSFEPLGWKPAPTWDPVAGDYRTIDGWIKLHTNAPAHQRAALGVFGVPVEREAVERAVAGWLAEGLEAAVVEAGGMRGSHALRRSVARARAGLGRLDRADYPM